MNKIPLHIQVIIGLILGAGFAYLSIIFEFNKFTLDYIKPIGDIFINLLKLIAVPLVLFSIIVGVASLGDVKKLGRLGSKTLLTYVLTTLTAVVLGLVLVNIFKPGANVSDELRTTNRIRYELWKEDVGAKQLDDIDFLNDPSKAELVATVRAEMAGEENSAELQDKLDKANKKKSSGP
ncbi:MAG: cation:dicarboxylase symporter family transporter, partial [Flavobacteriales bacterium]|nr:cation:dicarboxylase symporter family transporter [Flavobacteriales bacterium]